MLCLLLALWTGTAHAQGIEAWQPPTLTTVRYDEDWHRLADPQERTGRWTERFKYVPLDENATYLVTGLELRARNENYRANLWGGAQAPDDGFLWLRALPYADLHAGAVRAFVQPVAAYTIGVAPSASPIDRTGIDLLQGFADIRIGAGRTGDADALGLTIRAGRELLSLGNERLVGTRYGPNVPLAFDGVRAIVSLPGAVVSILDKRPVRQGLDDLDDRSDRRRRLSGLYATIPHGAGEIDLYWLRYRNSAATFADGAGRETRHSIGARLGGAAGDWHWDAEGVFQHGRLGTSRIRAWTGSVELGRRFPDASLSPDALVRVSVISGDRRAGDGRLGTFNALFPRGKYFGELSPIGPANLVTVTPRVTLVIAEPLTVALAATGYWRHAIADGIYAIPGNLIRAAGNSRVRSIGQELEASFSWQASPELEVSGAVSAFAAGAFLRATGPHRTVGLLALETNFRF
ncbi:alginate export family protein [Croceibacterium sp. TMG7-5b_MA50]|uniref:alginate export family protein n=1 Tax=Croceibacterium sp. TMG7-5b_MA50 TaxID=3121290 RepID=UPI003221684B